VHIGQWWLLALDATHYIAVHIYQLDAQHKTEHDLFSFLLHRLNNNIMQFISITPSNTHKDTSRDKKLDPHFDNSPGPLQQALALAKNTPIRELWLKYENSPSKPFLSPKKLIEEHQKNQRLFSQNDIELHVIMLLIPLVAITVYSGVILIFFNLEIGDFTGISLIGHIVIITLLITSLLGARISTLKKKKANTPP